jgi:xanthine dehydrogenase accessory factor
LFDILGPKKSGVALPPRAEAPGVPRDDSSDRRPESFFHEILAHLEGEQPFALGTVVHTSGSTPQKAGARAIFLPDGRVHGTLGGGCMEMEARRRALEMISTGINMETRRHEGSAETDLREAGQPDGSASAPEHLNTHTPEHLLLNLHLDDDFGWDDGLICGGSSQIFLQRIDPAAERSNPALPTPNTRSVYAAAVALKAKRRRAMLAMLVEAPSPGDVGGTLLVPEEGPVFGALGNNALVEELTETARRLLAEGGEAPRYLALAGGAARAYFEPILPRPVLLILGAGHIGTALTHFGARIGFEVVVTDDRASFANRERLPDADEVIVDSVVNLLRRWPKTPETYVVLVTRGHRNDAVALREVIGSPCAYIGMIGSRRKVLTIYDEFLAEGIATPEQLARVHAPVGLDIGALTVDEIAVSIAAELIAVRRKGVRVQDKAGTCPEPLHTRTPEHLNSEHPERSDHAERDRAGGGGIPADGNAEAALALRQRERDRAGRSLVERLPDRRRAGGGGSPRG